MSSRRAGIGSLLTIVLLTLIVAAPPVVAAGTGGRIYFMRNDGASMAVAPDGTGLGVVPCGGDRTHHGVPRRVLRIEAADGTFAAYLETGLLISKAVERVVSTDEACGDRIVLADLPSGYDAVAAAWSIDDARVALSIGRYGPTGQLLDQGVWVGEVGAACGAGICGLRLAVTLPMVPAGAADPATGLVPYVVSTPATMSWSSDGRRIVFGTPSGIRVADLGIPGDTVVRSPSSVSVAAPTIRGQVVVPRDPAFSPIPGDDRIAFAMVSSVKSCWRSDLYTVRPNGGSPTRIATSTNGMCELSRPTWSPDGLWLAFDAWPGSLAANHAIYTFRADSSGKVIQLTPTSSSVSYHAPSWRL